MPPLLRRLSRWQPSQRLFFSSLKNEVNIEMLPADLHSQLFPQPVKPVDSQIVELAKEHLREHQMPFDQNRPPFPYTAKVSLPPLAGNDLEEHWWRLGDWAGRGWFRLAQHFAHSPDWLHPISREQTSWIKQAGWTEYDAELRPLGRVEHPPQEQALVLDVETCPAHGGWPLVAVAMTLDRLYVWISPVLLPSDTPVRDELVPLGPAQDGQAPALVIGHNVSYDRARVREEYRYKLGERRYLDTMSLHAAIAGLSSQQRPGWCEFKKRRDAELGDAEETKKWQQESSMSNLADAVRLHCQHSMDKSPRSLLVDGTLATVKDNLDTIISYCANDVAATGHLFRALWPQFTRKCPHPVTFAAILDMATAWLPVDGEWRDYQERCEQIYHQAKTSIEDELRSLVELRLAEGLVKPNDCTEAEASDGKAAYKMPEDDPWLNKLDWTPLPPRYTKARFKKDGSYAQGGEPRPIGNPALWGKPAWWRDLLHQGRIEITPRTRIVPYLLKMRWEGHPVHFIDGHGWCVEVAAGASSHSFKGDPIEGRFWKIPHAEGGQDQRVGCLLSKQYLAAVQKGIITCESDLLQKVIKINGSFSFWTGYRERIMRDNFVVWERDHPFTELGNVQQERGMIIPAIVPMGTVTRRAVEATWMTATNAKATLVGSELKAMIKVPRPDCWIVGADVDSQELWISSLLGDSAWGIHGATAMSWMTLQGSKQEGTDLHSRSAAILGMGRDEAKIFCYGRIYGAGQRYAAQLLAKFNPKLTAKEAEDKAAALYAGTKGVRLEGMATKLWAGGSESFMFNQLEAIARSPESRTPALGCIISDALLQANVDNEVNFPDIKQSST